MDAAFLAADVDGVAPVDVLQMPLAAAGDEADRGDRDAAAVVVDEIGTSARIEVAPAHQPAAADFARFLRIARDEPGGKDARLDTRRLAGARGPARVVVYGGRTKR
ncbi:hypothetical protein [uncultured Sphingomonas sp.]|uniref:hypothetical protein n=1 Tax=uncultured Sphingomonas sp. TaxID=158754 RepID=UPI0025D7BCFD|nr:hypothetical protein [uncultured Sphingomonas sp.]